MTKLYLVSTSGDYSRFGMGDSNHALTIPKKHLALIKRFMKAQWEYYTNVITVQTGDEFTTTYKETDENMTEIIEKYWELCAELMKAGIFKNKYHCRTTWTIEYEEDLHEHEPIKIDEE